MQEKRVKSITITSSGPWQATGIDMYGNHEIWAGDACIALAYSGDLAGETVYPAESNARLIAAAPDLLLALQIIIGLERDADGLLGLTPINIRRAEAAVAKATGDSQ
jgi:hypothetical protein